MDVVPAAAPGTKNGLGHESGGRVMGNGPNSRMKSTGFSSCHTKWLGSQFRVNASRWPMASRVPLVDR